MVSLTTISDRPAEWRLGDLVNAALACQLPVAAWRSPGADAAQAVVDLSGSARWTRIDFRRQTPGFVFSPFYSAQDWGALHIRADLHLSSAGLRALSPAAHANGQWQRLQEAKARSARNGRGVQWYTPAMAGDGDRALGEAEYCRLVRQAIDFIAGSGIEKVVVSRMMETPLPAGFDPVSLFERLAQRYPEAFVSLVAVPGIGTWLGASPELLLAVDRQALSTMALAGTQARQPGHALSAVRWGPKERAEQALVGDYVRDFFRRQGIVGVQEDGPRTVAAGNLVHLQTAFRVELPQAERLALANQVLHDLHPTSAVCGMPKDKALAFILAHEGYDRSFYSGFLGPVHIDGLSGLYVNLRCMQLREDRAVLYVGGGVTAESDPCVEWRETVLKSQTLLSVLHALPALGRSDPVPALAGLECHP